MLQEQALEVTLFNGGMTDNFIDGHPSRGEEYDNVFITSNSKLKQRPGSALYDSSHAGVFPDSVRIGALPFQEDQSQIFAHIANKLYTKVGGTWALITTPSTNPIFGSDASTDFVVSWAEWNKHLFATRGDLTTPPVKTYQTGASAQAIVSAGMPPLASSPTATPGTVGTANSYIYAFVYYRTYTIYAGGNSVTFEDFGTPTYVSKQMGAVVSGGNVVALAAIPTFANATGENFDTTNMKVKIYRTTDGGRVFYYVDQVSNGTATYNDSTTDATLATHATLYTEGGVQDADRPPYAKYLANANDIMFYGHVKEGGVVLSNRIRHSFPSDPDSCPESFFVDVKSEITGMGSVGKYAIALCKDRVYRLEGFVDSLGRGVIQAVEIDSTVGCVSSLSIVPVQDGLFFAGTDGFYFTNGYKCLRVSTEIDDTYLALIDTATKQRRICGAYDRLDHKVWWTVQRDAAASENDACFILDLQWGVKPDSIFTTASGATFLPTALAFDGANIVRATKAGIYGLVYHNSAFPNDYDYATGADATIIYRYASCALAFGTTVRRKWVTRMLVSLADESNISLQINSNNNDGQRVRPLSEIRFRQDIVWGDPSITWGDPNVVWNYSGVIERIRRFPAGDLRCNYKQVILTNAYTVIARSDDYGLAAISDVSGTVRQALIPIAWPTASKLYFISFEDDNYVRQYPITTVSSGTIHFTDTGHHQMSGTTRKWLLKGYPKDEIFHLLSYVLYYAALTPSQRQVRTADAGENA